MNQATNGASGDAQLEFRQIVKEYGGRPVLREVSLAIRPGRFMVLLGPSGSGKTTMLRCAAGIERVTRGETYLSGQLVDDGRRYLPPERRDLAMVFQDYALWPHLTARENVRYALRRRKLSSTEADQQARDMLARVGLSALTERYPSELSGGEQQRVALARAMVARPRLLLFDEPLSNLDASLREQLRVEISTLVREAEATALYITHDQSEAFALADEVGVLQQGQLVQLGTPEAIYTTPISPFVARLTGLAGEIPGQVAGIQPDGYCAVNAAGYRLIARAGGPVAPATAARILVRPSAVRLLPPTSGVDLTGRVRDVAFSGRGYAHALDLPGGVVLTGIFDDDRWARGDTVGVSFDPRGCLLYPDTGANGAPGAPAGAGDDLALTGKSR
jgi:iron(III) transport system ATP-binding protein